MLNILHFIRCICIYFKNKNASQAIFSCLELKRIEIAPKQKVMNFCVRMKWVAAPLITVNSEQTALLKIFHNLQGLS